MRLCGCVSVSHPVYRPCGVGKHCFHRRIVVYPFSVAAAAAACLNHCLRFILTAGRFFLHRRTQVCVQTDDYQPILRTRNAHIHTHSHKHTVGMKKNGGLSFRVSVALLCCHARNFWLLHFHPRKLQYISKSTQQTHTHTRAHTNRHRNCVVLQRTHEHTHTHRLSGAPCVLFCAIERLGSCLTFRFYRSTFPLTNNHSKRDFATEGGVLVGLWLWPLRSATFVCDGCGEKAKGKIAN